MKPDLCDDCKADLHRAYCKTFPITCRDQVELYEDGFEAGRDAAAKAMGYAGWTEAEDALRAMRGDPFRGATSAPGCVVDVALERETDDPRIAASLRPPKRRCLCHAAMAGERLYCSIHNRWSQP